MRCPVPVVRDSTRNQRLKQEEEFEARAIDVRVKDPQGQRKTAKEVAVTRRARDDCEFHHCAALNVFFNALQRVGRAALHFPWNGPAREEGAQ